MKAYAFDRDGTLAWGSPPGPVTRAHLLMLKRLGYAIGGSGGQSPEEQYKNWRDNGVDPDFVVHKRGLHTLKGRFECVVHVGDSEDDRRSAESAGFGYMKPEEFILSLQSSLSQHESSR